MHGSSSNGTAPVRNLTERTFSNFSRNIFNRLNHYDEVRSDGGIEEEEEASIDLSDMIHTSDQTIKKATSIDESDQKSEVTNLKEVMSDRRSLREEIT